MRTSLISLIFAFVVGLFAADADAARRFGGGGNLGKQRATPTQKEATPAPAQAPAQQAAPANAAGTAGAAAAAKPSFMQRWGGLLAGLGIGMLLSSLFGAQLGPIIGMLLLGLVIAAVAFMLYRLFAGGGRRAQPATSPAMAFSGIGSRAGEPTSTEYRGSGNPAPVVVEKPQIEAESFLRVAKTSFIRLQAANDAGDLDDIRDYTTPEMFAEISMQVKERGGVAQRTEVVSLNAEMVETAIEGDHEIASVRFYGLIRENAAANPEPFDEIWHVRKDRRDRRGAWLISGIQQKD
ncbi:MAG TPA: Tim44-like domain-containing protein [Usitatibacter sp.]|nr:Tim44-like domain-containing protein [Usitatibacter sp.]